jgi:hypothetical protein
LSHSEPKGPRDIKNALAVQVFLVGVLMPTAFYFLLQGDRPGGLPYLVTGLILLGAALAVGWSIWKTP